MSLKLNTSLVCAILFFLLVTPIQAATFPDIATKIGQIYDLEEQTYPLYTTTGFDVDGDGTIDSLASLDTKYTTLPKDQLGELRAQLLCTHKPAVTDLEGWGNLRKCLHAGNIILARHHIFEYLNHGENQVDKDKAAIHLYLLATELDALTTGSDQPNVFQITKDYPTGDLTDQGKLTYKLRDTSRATRYVMDTGAPKDFGYAYSLGLLPHWYCTTLEIPFDPGSSCKTINLWERVRDVMSAMTTRAASEWLIHADGTQRGEFWDSLGLWDPATYTNNGGTLLHWGQQNTVYNPGANIGWPDLLGRRTMGNNTALQYETPGFYIWQMGGMADTAKLVLNEGGIYQTAYTAGSNVLAYSTAFDSTNWLTNNTQVNLYGQPTRDLSNYCTGTVNKNATDPLQICEGGKTEWFRYVIPDSNITSFNDLTAIAYNGQHLLNDIYYPNPLPQPYTDQALNFYNAFKANYYKDGVSYIDFQTGGFNEAAINSQFSNLIGKCGDTNLLDAFFRTNSGTGRLVYKTGETAAELLPTFLPFYIGIVATKDTVKAAELTTIADSVLTPLLTTPLNPADSACAAGTGGAGSTNPYARRAWHTANLLLSYYEFKKLSSSTLPKACDANADGAITTLDIKTHLNNYLSLSSDCTNDLKDNALDYAATQLLVGKPVAPPVVIPVASPTPAVTAVADFDSTLGDIETTSRPKVSVLSADGKTIYSKFYDTNSYHIWDNAWTITDIASSKIGQQTGLTTIRSFNQAMAPSINEPRQTLVAPDGLNYWIRFYSSGAWQTWTQYLTTTLALPNADTKIAALTLTQGDAETADPGTSQTRAKMMIVSADGTKIYYKFYNTNGSNQWDSSWGSITIATSAIGTQLGVTTLRSFTQEQVLPNGQPMQEALSVDGKTRYERYWTTGTWGTWKVYPNSDLTIFASDSPILPLP